MATRRNRKAVIARRVVLEARYELHEGVPADTAVRECLDDLLTSNGTQDGADPLHGLRVVKIEMATERASNVDL